MYSKSNEKFRLIRTSYAYAWLELDLVLPPAPKKVEIETPKLSINGRFTLELAKFKTLDKNQKNKLMNKWLTFSPKQKQIVLARMRELRK